MPLTSRSLCALSPARALLRPRLFIAALLLALVGCDGQRPALYQEQLYVFGTLVDITLWDVKPNQAERAVREISADFQVMHREWHAWGPGALTDLNRALAAGRAVAVPDHLLPLLHQSQDLYTRSDGLFNPAIGGLIALWGFHNDQPPSGPPPAREAIARWVARQPGMDDLEIAGSVVRSGNTAVQLDLGAFAKGYAIDVAIARLRALGIRNAIVNGGGDLRAIGRRGDRPWRVGIRHPQGSGIIASVEVEGDESVFTSGNYERYRQHEGVRYQHILDPRTGMPVEGVTSVTVIHDNGAEADAAATALVVAGPRDWHRIAARMGIQYVMLVDEQGTVYMNPAMVKRVHFEAEPAPRVVVSPPL